MGYLLERSSTAGGRSMYTRMYAPPNIDRAWLCDQVLQQYPNHRKCAKHIEDLVEEYLRFWRLVLTYPERRVVAPGPIFAVMHAHRQDAEAYFAHCMAYFNRFLYRELVWRGGTDVRGTIDTVAAYEGLFREKPAGPWIDIVEMFELKRSFLRVVQ